MGLFRKIVNQTRKPEGLLGKMMVNGMNSGHAKTADWGMSHLRAIVPDVIIDGMKCHTAKEIETALNNAGFSKVKTDHHRSRPWITVLTKK